MFSPKLCKIDVQIWLIVRAWRRSGWISTSIQMDETNITIQLHSKLELQLPSLKLTFSHLKMDGWNTSVAFWDGLFAGRTVSFRECIQSSNKRWFFDHHVLWIFYQVESRFCILYIYILCFNAPWIFQPPDFWGFPKGLVKQEPGSWSTKRSWSFGVVLLERSD